MCMFPYINPDATEKQYVNVAYGDIRCSGDRDYIPVFRGYIQATSAHLDIQHSVCDTVLGGHVLASGDYYSGLVDSCVLWF